jgi:hypothetical protein
LPTTGYTSDDDHQSSRYASEALWNEFIENIELKKNVLDYRKSESFFEEAVKKDLHGMPILSTGGYNDHFLTFVSHVFNT